MKCALNAKYRCICFFFVRNVCQIADDHILGGYNLELANNKKSAKLSKNWLPEAQSLALMGHTILCQACTEKPQNIFSLYHGELAKPGWFLWNSQNIYTRPV